MTCDVCMSAQYQGMGVGGGCVPPVQSDVIYGLKMSKASEVDNFFRAP